MEAPDFQVVLSFSVKKQTGGGSIVPPPFNWVHNPLAQLCQPTPTAGALARSEAQVAFIPDYDCQLIVNTLHRIYNDSGCSQLAPSVANDQPLSIVLSGRDSAGDFFGLVAGMFVWGGSGG